MERRFKLDLPMKVGLGGLRRSRVGRQVVEMFLVARGGGIWSWKGRRRGGTALGRGGTALGRDGTALGCYGLSLGKNWCVSKREKLHHDATRPLHTRGQAKGYPQMAQTGLSRELALAGHAQGAQRRREDRDDVGDREDQRDGEEGEAGEEEAAGEVCTGHWHVNPFGCGVASNKAMSPLLQTTKNEHAINERVARFYQLW